MRKNVRAEAVIRNKKRNDGVYGSIIGIISYMSSAKFELLPESLQDVK